MAPPTNTIARFGIKQGIGADDCRDSAAGADHRPGAFGIEQIMAERGNIGPGNVKHGQTISPERALNAAPTDKHQQHIEDDMHGIGMQQRRR